MTYPVGQWTFGPDGGLPDGAALYNGPVLFPAGIDPATTQTAVCVFGPGGARVTIPPVAQGESGPPPQLRNITLHEVAYGTSLPVPAASWTEITPGAPGVAAVYDLDMSVHGGAPGDVASFLIASAEDLVGTLFNGAVAVWNTTTSTFNPSPQLVGGLYNNTGIATTGTTAGQNRTLSYLTVPAQPFPWWPIVQASTVITGTANTQVDLIARLNSETGGQIIGRGQGQTGAVTGTNPYVTTLIPAFGSAVTGTGVTYGQVASGSAATIYLRTEQQASTTDTYSTGTTFFTVDVKAVPPS